MGFPLFVCRARLRAALASPARFIAARSTDKNVFAVRYQQPKKADRALVSQSPTMIIAIPDDYHGLVEP